MTKHNDYEALKASLLADIAKACDNDIVERATSLLDALEDCATRAGDVNIDAAPGLTLHASVDTNEDVRHLTTVNLVALVAIAAVAIAALVVHK